MKRLSCLIIVAWASLSLAACSSTEEDLCDAQCDCEGCSPSQYDDCVRHYDNELRDAEYEGCVDWYDDWIDCQDSTWWCSRDDFHHDCSREHDRLHDCIR